MVSHWFSASQWQLPNESDYLKLQSLFARVAEEKHQRGELEKPHHQLVDTYTSLNRQYVELQSEYKHLRRYFGVTAQASRTRMCGHINRCSSIPGNIRAKNRQKCCSR